MKRFSMLSTFLAMVVAFVFVFANPIFAGIDDGLVAYYPFNGNADDASGNKNHGTVNGASLCPDKSDVVESAYCFDGLDDYIAFPDGVFGISVAGFTFSCWVSTSATDFQENKLIVYKGAINGEASLLTFENQFKFQVKLSNHTWYKTGSPVVADSYVHLVGVYKRGECIELWVNGSKGELFVEEETR